MLEAEASPSCPRDSGKAGEAGRERAGVWTAVGHPELLEFPLQDGPGWTPTLPGFQNFLAVIQSLSPSSKSSWSVGSPTHCRP